MEHRVRVSLTLLVEKPEKVLGPEWRKEGVTESLDGTKQIALRAQADDETSPVDKLP